MKTKWNLGVLGVMVLTVVAHTFGGGPQIWEPVFNSNLSEVVRISVGLCWHGLTGLFVVMAALSLTAYIKPELSHGINISLLPINLLFGGVALIYGFMATGNVWVLPQWILFLPIAMFSFLAVKASIKNT